MAIYSKFIGDTAMKRLAFVILILASALAAPVAIDTADADSGPPRPCYGC